MLFLVLGKGKTGSLVADVVRERGSGVRSLDITENQHACALTAPTPAGVLGLAGRGPLVPRLRFMLALAVMAICPLCVIPAAGAQTAAPPAAPQLHFVYEEFVTLAEGIPVGETPIGKRNIVPITGGTFDGPGLRGKIEPGGWDWQLTLPSGCFQLHADYFIQTDDGVTIHVVNGGMICPNSAGKREALLTTPLFEAPKGKYDWLNGGAFVGTLDVTKIDGKPAVHIRFYKAFAD